MFNMQPRYVVILAACVTSVFCGAHPDGASKVSRSQDALGNYQFGYTVSNVDGEHFRQEGTDALGRVVGSYGLTQADGRHRVVDYVADKDGFRAHIRSNEPGVENSNAPAATIERTDQSLDTAATSHEDPQDVVYGKRLQPTASRVAYVETDLEDVPRRPQHQNIKDYRSDGPPRESRQRNIPGYQPVLVTRQQIGTDYRPGVVSRPQNPSEYHPEDGPGIARRRPQSPPIDVRPPEAYYPPIDPHTAIRRPVYYLPRNPDDSGYSTTTSRRPFIPPYGGFENEQVDRYPGVSMTTIHGGLDSSSYPHPTPSTRLYGAGRYPTDDSPPRDISRRRHPSDDENYALPRYPGNLPPLQSGSPHVLFGGRPSLPPSHGAADSPNLVLRAVPIPNGIQAIRVDPTTGRVYERLDYPMYTRQSGYPSYDSNILIHNDDIGDDDRQEPRNYDVPLRGRPGYRGARNQPFDGDYAPDSRQYNRSYVSEDEESFSKPSARDLALVHRHLAILNQDRYRPNQPYPNALEYALPVNSRYPDFDDEFEDSEGVPPGDNFGYRNSPRALNPYAGSVPESQLFDRPGEYQFSRYPRNSRSRRLTPTDSKETVVSKLEANETNSKEAQIETKESELQKE